MFDIFKVVSQYQKLSEDVYKLSREVSLLNNRLDNKEREENTSRNIAPTLQHVVSEIKR